MAIQQNIQQELERALATRNGSYIRPQENDGLMFAVCEPVIWFDSLGDSFPDSEAADTYLEV